MATAAARTVYPHITTDPGDTRPLTLAEVYAALAYYNDHKDEVEADFAEAERVAAEGLAAASGDSRSICSDS